MANTLRTGVIGCGGLGPSEAKISHEMEGIELVGVVGREHRVRPSGGR